VSGKDYSVVVSWGVASEFGEVYVNDRQVHSWRVFSAFKSTKFAVDGFHMEVKARERGFGTLLDVDLYVEGRLAEDLPQPTWFHEYARRSPSVVQTRPHTCPKCSREAVMLIYDTGSVEIVCTDCGRSAL